jgi:hypothetical protein
VKASWADVAKGIATRTEASPTVKSLRMMLLL